MLFVKTNARGRTRTESDDGARAAPFAAGNVTDRRLRHGNSIAFTFDNLNRPTLKNLPETEPDVTYGYDLLGRMTSASQTGHSLSFTYDTLGRNLTQSGPKGTIISAWDLAGRRTRITHPDGFHVDLVRPKAASAPKNAGQNGPRPLGAFRRRSGAGLRASGCRRRRPRW